MSEETDKIVSESPAAPTIMPEPPSNKEQIHKKVYKEVHRHLKDDRTKLYLKVFALYAVLALVMFWYVTINITSAVPNGSSDAYQSMWNLWWDQFSAFNLHTSPYFTNLIFFPVGANLVTQDLMPLAGLISAPIQWISLPLAYNLIFFAGFALGGLFAFALIFHITKSKYGSFLGGLIFAFSPMHVAQSIAHLNWASIEFIPLFILFFILMIEQKRWRYVIGAGVTFVFVTFFGDPLQAILTLVFAIVLLALYLISKQRKDILNLGYIKRLLVMVVVILIVGAVFFVPIISGLLQPGVISSANQLSDTPNFMLWSDNLASYFLPSYYNGLFNGISLSYYNTLYGLTYQGAQYIPDISEKVSYIGYTVLALVLVALYFDYKENKLGKTWSWLAILLLFGWLSLGPFIQIMGTVTGIPGIYAVYSHLPGFNLLREPGRFDLIVTLCLGVLAAMGFQNLIEGKDKKTARIYGIVFLVLILIEYNAIPLTSAFANMLIAPAQIPVAYSQIGNITGNFSVLTLPALPNESSDAPELYPAMAMYYQTAMNGKPILGGYTSRFNDTQTASLSNIPLVTAASYLQSGDGLVYPSPIIGNFTNETLIWLASYNVEFVPIIRSAYNLSEQEVLYNYMYDTFGAPIYEDNSTFIFSTRNEILTHGGKALTAYSAGTWIPGYSFCGANCTAAIGSLWFGSNVRGVIIYAPNATEVTMNMIAFGYVNNTQLYVYLNNNHVSTMNLSDTSLSYSTTFNVTQGFNQLILAAQNNTEVPSPYLIYGVRNITFSAQSR